MTKMVEWNEDVYTEFSRLAMLSSLEREILRTRIMGYSVSWQSMNFNISERSVHRLIKSLKNKYKAVQPYSDKLPPMKKSAKELYMDNH